jgi:uncharacterized protein (TIGR00251 family)
VVGQDSRLKASEGETILAVRLTPRASRDRILGLLPDGTIRIQVSAPPVAGQANRALIEFLADVLKVAKSRVRIISGASGRNKLVSVLGMDVEMVHRKVLRQLK